jgi:hypothetical protein
MINPNESAQYLCAVEIVHGQIRGSLIFVANESVAFRFARFLISNQIDVNYFSVLRENANYVAFGQIERHAAKEYPGTLSVLIVPRVLRAHGAHFDLIIIQFIQISHIT